MNIKVAAAGRQEPILHCPNCNHEIKLTESLAAPLLDESIAIDFRCASTGRVTAGYSGPS
jgi:hypothetical protein